MVRPLKRGQRSTVKYVLILVTSQQKAPSNWLNTDNYEEDKLLTSTLLDIKVYDGINAARYRQSSISRRSGVLYGTSKASLTKAISATDVTPVIDTIKFEFGRYYKFDIPAVVKDIDS